MSLTHMYKHAKNPTQDCMIINTSHFPSVENLEIIFAYEEKKVLEIRNFAFFSTLNVKNMQKEAPLDVLFVINFTPLTEFVTFKALSSNFVARWNISIIVYKSGNWVKKTTDNFFVNLPQYTYKNNILET